MNLPAEQIDTANDFGHDVLYGLSQPQKSIPCKWFYDEAGSLLFEAITRTAEYYPTRVETRLLAEVVPALARIKPGIQCVIEPGSGASVKTRALLQGLPLLQTYVPMDISADFLHEVSLQLQRDFPALAIHPLVGDFSDAGFASAINTADLPIDSERLVFFPGSTIGNFHPEAAARLLEQFHALAGGSGCLLIGVDTTQDEKRLLAAYNDAAGITAAFNQNLLKRANRELGADFDVHSFSHEARFNPSEGRIEMHLVSTRKQSVQLAGKCFGFDAGETIYTESCYKYRSAAFIAMAQACGWHLQQHWQDEQESAFTLFLLRSAR
ncbi:L-histidine N(alpha)-methyltransferase [Pseudomethylobacillus aquaticus]|uniref:L-histidine N(Alpha)-methyltransferase n=1 Tax=Pseudomethylobacillus aquaticus TaxID=2676064 RepID=A0A3N0V2R8_9PROT|nr:L-histidine N(alpha)-methyltransferase [Pseudomethylobacillus aquaticus]ROH87069.1 L-histidine N(alpha)-methyltransferase [Pseudomethylobacillus aquaticus]